MNWVSEGCDGGREAVAGLGRELEHRRGHALSHSRSHPRMRCARNVAVKLAKREDEATREDRGHTAS